MKLPFELMQKEIRLPAATVEEIRLRAEKLDHFFGRVMRCRVTVEGSGIHHRQGRYGVKVDVTVPGAEILVHKREGANLELALKAAFEAVARRLEDYVRRRRGFVKAKAAFEA